MTFREFAKLLAGLDCPLGDLAADIQRAKDLDDEWDSKRILQYLRYKLGYDDRCKLAYALVKLYRVGIE